VSSRAWCKPGEESPRTHALKADLRQPWRCA